MPIYFRRKPSTNRGKGNHTLKAATAEERKEGLETEEQRELRLATALANFSSRGFYDRYIKGEEVTEPEKELIDMYNYIIQEYDISETRANLLEIKEWCEEKAQEFSNETIKEMLTVGIFTKKARRTQREFEDESSEERRIRLGRALHSFEKSRFYKEHEADLLAGRAMINQKDLSKEDKEIIRLYNEIQDFLKDKENSEQSDETSAPEL